MNIEIQGSNILQIQRISNFCSQRKHLSVCPISSMFAVERLMSDIRVQCAISLPQPQDTFQNALDVPRVLNTKTVIPDCAIFIPASRTRALSHSAKSPYKLLKNHPTVVKAGNAAKRSSFRYQSTPCAQLPDMPGFEFASSFWEDKKPVHALLDDAYRQNRMSTTAAVRHLHSLGIRAPITGLIWADGVVRAHVDWCEESEGKTVCHFAILIWIIL